MAFYVTALTLPVFFSWHFSLTTSKLLLVPLDSPVAFQLALVRVDKVARYTAGWSSVGQCQCPGSSRFGNLFNVVIITSYNLGKFCTPESITLRQSLIRETLNLPMFAIVTHPLPAPACAAELSWDCTFHKLHC